MTLTEARKKFDALRLDPSRVLVHAHAYRAHRGRGFNAEEIRRLCAGSGILRENHVARPLPGSFVWWCRDIAGRRCELAVVFEVDDRGDLILVISAFRQEV